MSSCNGDCNITGSCKICKVEFCSYGYNDCDLGRPGGYRLGSHKYCLTCYSIAEKPQIELRTQVKELTKSLKNKLKTKVDSDILKVIILEIYSKLLGEEPDYYELEGDIDVDELPNECTHQ